MGATVLEQINFGVVVGIRLTRATAETQQSCQPQLIELRLNFQWREITDESMTRTARSAITDRLNAKAKPARIEDPEDLTALESTRLNIP